jgi:hypothetical protein
MLFLILDLLKNKGLGLVVEIPRALQRMFITLKVLQRFLNNVL